LRHNIFLHFLNRDTREVFDLYDNLSSANHAQLMRRALNAAAILCEAHCIAPPGFIVEDQIAFELAENQQAFLRDGLIQLPMRENNLADFAEKKRIGYEPMRDRYSGLFNDTRIGFLGRHATGIIPRKSHITQGILAEWSSGAEVGRKIWRPAKKLLVPSLIDEVSKIPEFLDQRGTAVTWAAIRPELPAEALSAQSPLRDVLQHVYFLQYCIEFDLIALSAIHYIVHDFRIPTESGYNYRLFGKFLDVFELSAILFDAPADLIVALRQQPGFIAFIDAFISLSRKFNSDTDVIFFAGRARRAVNFLWASLPDRKLSLYDLSPIEINELADALDEVAATLAVEHGLPIRNKDIVRGTHKPIGTKSKAYEKLTVSKRTMSKHPDLVFFVALEEELEVLARSLDLKKVAATPEATGNIAGVDVAVICPRTMGRVAAAVAMTQYLATRDQQPKLILIVGLAGGFRENNSIPGHILLVTKVVDLALRKVTDETEGPSPNFRREDYAMDDQLMKQILSDDFDRDSWSATACRAFDWPSDRRPSIHRGPIASTDEVLASDVWRSMMLKGNGGDQKLLGIEMEAGGVCAVARRMRVPVSMLRVVSDNADPSKTDDSWRKRGMETLADLLKNISINKVIDALG